MKKTLLLAALAALAAAFALSAQVPAIINYQGRLSVGGSNVFDGLGQFKFALVSPGTNTSRQATASATVSGGFVTLYTVLDGGAGYLETPTVTITDSTGSNATAKATIVGGVVTQIDPGNPGRNYSPTPTVTVDPPPPAYVYGTFWSNDGTSNAGSEPALAVPLTVSQGLFLVNLGDTSIPGMTEVIDPPVFTNLDVRLRVWFSDGVNGFQQFYPDQRFTTTPYAMLAGSVPNGTITSSQIAPGAITAAALAPSAVSSAALAPNAVGAIALAPNAVGSLSIQNGAVTEEKLSDGAVTSVKLASDLRAALGHSMSVFTTNGTWLKPPGVSSVHVRLWGGGGGGRHGSWTYGGGGGGYCEGIVTVTGDVQVIVGAGGTGGSSRGAGWPDTLPSDGGSSSFLSLIATGGGAGKQDDYGKGGAGSGGLFNGTGWRGTSTGGAAFCGGEGGTAGGGSVPGGPGAFPGGGGGSGGSYNSVPSDGGNGASGLVIICY